MKQNCINHIIFLLDSSLSMRGNQNSLVKVFDKEIKNLKDLSVKMSQETRVTIFSFDKTLKNVVYDMDVLRVGTLNGHYVANGTHTRLTDSVIDVINEMKNNTYQAYGDHAFLVYCLTDGQDNASSRGSSNELKNLINSLQSNWTMTCLVPSSSDVFYAKSCGFHANNISIWNPNDEKSLESVGEIFRVSTQTYFENRSKGIRSTSSFFQLDDSKLDSANVNSKNLTVMNPDTFVLGSVKSKSAIKSKELVLENGLNYYNGCLFYHLVKTETIQPQKEIIIRNKKSHHTYRGNAARTLLGLPSNTPVQVDSIKNDNFDIYVQSTAPNRNMIPNQKYIILK